MDKCVVCGGPLEEYYDIIQGYPQSQALTQSRGWGCTICGLSYKKKPDQLAMAIQKRIRDDVTMSSFNRMFADLPDKRKDG